jgi:hypothetical protein
MYCSCLNVYCNRVTTQLQLINISYHKIAVDNNLDSDGRPTKYRNFPIHAHLIWTVHSIHVLMDLTKKLFRWANPI